MTAPLVIKHLDVIEEIGPRFITGVVNPSLDPFSFQKLKKAFDHGIVMAITPPAHATFQTMILKEDAPVMAGVLTALVRMDHHFSFRLASPDCHQQGIEHQLLGDSGLHGPANNPTGKQVYHHARYSQRSSGEAGLNCRCR